MIIDSLPLSNGSDGKEQNALLKAINRVTRVPSKTPTVFLCPLPCRLKIMLMTCSTILARSRNPCRVRSWGAELTLSSTVVCILHCTTDFSKTCLVVLGSVIFCHATLDHAPYTCASPAAILVLQCANGTHRLLDLNRPASSSVLWITQIALALPSKGKSRRLTRPPLY